METLALIMFIILALSVGLGIPIFIFFLLRDKKTTLIKKKKVTSHINNK